MINFGYEGDERIIERGWQTPRLENIMYCFDHLQPHYMPICLEEEHRRPIKPLALKGSHTSNGLKDLTTRRNGKQVAILLLGYTSRNKVLQVIGIPWVGASKQISIKSSKFFTNIIPVRELYIVGIEDLSNSIVPAMYNSGEMEIVGIGIACAQPYGLSFVLPQHLFTFEELLQLPLFTLFSRIVRTGRIVPMQMSNGCLQFLDPGLDMTKDIFIPFFECHLRMFQLRCQCVTLESCLRDDAFRNSRFRSHRLKLKRPCHIMMVGGGTQ